MPLYEYYCETCHQGFEVRRSFSDEGVPACPNCNGTGRVRRKFSVPAIVFKGAGFYVNDSRGKNSAAKPAKEAQAKAKESQDKGSDSSKSSTGSD